jgi:hypothetical protein
MQRRGRKRGRKIRNKRKKENEYLGGVWRIRFL